MKIDNQDKLVEIDNKELEDFKLKNISVIVYWNSLSQVMILKIVFYCLTSVAILFGIYLINLNSVVIHQEEMNAFNKKSGVFKFALH